MSERMIDAGPGVVGAITRLGSSVLLLGHILVGCVPHRGMLRELMRQIYLVGARTLGIIFVGGMFVGLVLALQGVDTLSRFGASDATGILVSISLYRELGPVLTALLFAGRAGSSLAAELGLMRSTDQISSLSLMGIDPVRRLLVPRFLAGVIAVPLLTAVFVAAALLASHVQAVWYFGIDAGAYWGGVVDAVELQRDVVPGLLKAMLFGVAVTFLSLQAGYRSMPGAEGVATATTRAVAGASLTVLGLNFVFGLLWM